MAQAQAIQSGQDVTALMGGGGPVDRSQWDKRADGSTKGDGFLGVLQRPDGKVSSEISIGVNIDGKEVEIPTLVPTLTAEERQWLLTNDISDPRTIPRAIQQKAIDFARPRIAAGKSPFAQAGESPQAQQAPKSGDDVTALMTGASTLPFMSRTGPSVVGTAATDLAVGAVKGLGQTATNLGRLAHLVPGVTRAVDAIYGTPVSRQAFTEADQALAPTNTTQRVGKAAEQVAEVVIPGKALTSAGTTAAARFAPQLAPIVGKTAAKIIPRVAVEAAGNAGISAAQGGDPLVGGAVGAVAGVVPAIAGTKAVSALREQAEKKVVQALGPTKERFKAMAERLAPQILQRGLGGSRKALQANAASMVEEVGGQIDQALQQFGSQAVGTAPITAALETAKDAFRTTNAAGKVVEFEPRAIKQLDSLQKVIADLGPDATVDQLVAVRRAWDKVVDQAGGFAHRAGGAIGVPLKDQSEAWAKREATGAIRKVLATDVPELAAVNKEFAFWKSLNDVLTQTLDRTQAQGPGLGRQLAEGVGAAAASSHGLGAALGVGKLAKLANAVFTSPRWRFIDAQSRNGLADALVSGSAARVEGALVRITAMESSKMAATGP